MSARLAISTVLIAAPALGGVVLKMPAPPATAPIAKAVSSNSTAAAKRVTPLQRFVRDDPARDHAGDVILLTIPESSSDNDFAEWSTPRWGGSGYGYGNYGYGYGWGWGSPIIINEYCGDHRRYPARNGYGCRNSSMVFEAGFVLGF